MNKVLDDAESESVKCSTSTLTVSLYDIYNYNCGTKNKPQRFSVLSICGGKNKPQQVSCCVVKELIKLKIHK